jgi:hypothetical protein
MGKASKRRARKQAMSLNAVREANPALFWSYVGAQLKRFRRRAESRARHLGSQDTAGKRVWELMAVQAHFIGALHLSPEEKQCLLDESREICRSAFGFVMPHCRRQLNWSPRLEMLP